MARHQTATIEPEATALERNQINEAIVCLKRAKDADNERSMMMNLEEAFRMVRQVHRSRNEV